MLPRLLLLGYPKLIGTHGVSVPLRGRKAMALLAVLAMSNGRAKSRPQLAELLWDERPEAKARQNLRKELSHLRRGLESAGVEGLTAECDAVSLLPSAIETDVVELRRLATSNDLDNLTAAASLYQDDLLNGFFVNARMFDDWLSWEQALVREEATECLLRLSAINSAAGRHRDAIGAARRALALAPFEDDAICALLHAFGAAGRPLDGISAFDRYAAHIKTELGVSPSGRVSEARRRIASDTPCHTYVRHRSTLGGRCIVDVTSFSTTGQIGAGFADDVAERTALELARFRALDSGSRGVGAGSYRLTGALEQTAKGMAVHADLRASGMTAPVRSDQIELPFEAHSDLAHAFARRLAARIAPTVNARERERHQNGAERPIDAVGLARRGHDLVDEAVLSHNRAALRRGLSLSQRALDMDPECVIAWSALARGNTQRAFMQVPGRKDAISNAEIACDHLLALSPDDHRAHYRKGWLKFVIGDHDGAAINLRQALLLNPNDVLTQGIHGVVQAARGADERAMGSASEAIALAPEHFYIAWAFHAMHVAHFIRDEYDKGLVWAARLGPRERAVPALAVMAVASYAAAGKRHQAGLAFRRLQAKAPQYVDAYLSGRRQPFKFAYNNERMIKSLELARHAA